MSVWLEDTRLAGSALSLNDAISNLMQSTGLTLSDAVKAATTNPAVAARVPRRQKGLTENERADLVRFTVNSGRISVRETYLDGRLVYAAKNSELPGCEDDSGLSPS